MESLLRWSIQHSDGTRPSNATPLSQRTDLDPGIIDAILGKSDAELMREALRTATDEQRSQEDRLAALDDFEMVSECNAVIA